MYFHSTLYIFHLLRYKQKFNDRNNHRTLALVPKVFPSFSQTIGRLVKLFERSEETFEYFRIFVISVPRQKPSRSFTVAVIELEEEKIRRLRGDSFLQDIFSIGPSPARVFYRPEGRAAMKNCPAPRVNYRNIFFSRNSYATRPRRERQGTKVHEGPIASFRLVPVPCFVRLFATGGETDGRNGLKMQRRIRTFEYRSKYLATPP